MDAVAKPKRKPPAAPAAVKDAPREPAAKGHRFGPSLVCCWCGISYGRHHLEPQPCRPAASVDDPSPR